MPSVVLCLHAHLPLRLRKYGFFDIGHSQEYFDEGMSRMALERKAEERYLPANAILLKLIRRHRGRFRVSCCVSGMLLDKLELWQKSVLESFRRLADTGCAEFVCGPHYHSLASMFSPEEFREQVALHRRRVRSLFGQVSRTFQDTDPAVGGGTARIVEAMGFRAILAGGAGRPAGIDETVLYRPAGCRKASILFRHDALSDEMARLCRGEGRSAGEFALSLKETFREDEIVNLFLDYETPGPGIAALLESFPATVLKQRAWRFETPGEAAARHRPTGEMELPEPARPSAPLQKDALNTLYAMESRLRATGGKTFFDAWRNLQASDHFESMNTESPSDGAVRRAGQDWPSPYDAYIHYMNILKDFSGRIAGKTGVRP